MEEAVEHRSLKRSGVWRIAGYRYLEQRESADAYDLRIQLTIGRVADQLLPASNPGSIQGTLEEVLVPIGELPRLCLNSLIVDGILSNQRKQLAKQEVVTKTLNLDRNNIKVFKRFFEEQQTPIIPITQHSTPEDDEILYIAVGDGEDQYAVIIPSVEVFRFFYATSDTLTKTILSDWILDPTLHIFDPEKSSLDKRTARLWLRKDMQNADILHIARFIFDDYALQQAQNIQLNRMKQAAGSKKLAILAIPPIQGEVELKLLGRYIDQGRFLVTQIINCNWSPFFDNLLWSGDGRAQILWKDNEGVGQSIKLTKTISSPRALIDEPSDNDNAPSRIQDPEIAQRFPNLCGVQTEKIIKEESTNHPARRRVNREETVDFGTVIKGPDRGGDLRPSHIHGSDAPTLPDYAEEFDASEDTHEELEPIMGDKDNQCITILRLLNFANTKSIAKVTFITACRNRVIALTPEKNSELNSLPPEIFGKKKACLYTNLLKSSRRYALIAEISFEDRIRYIVEIQKRDNQDISTAVIWSPRGEAIATKDLYNLLIDCACSGNSKLPRADRLQLSWGRLRHTDTRKVDWDNPKEVVNKFLYKLFQVNPQPPSAG
ncbi:hypothetical protein ACVSMR_05685 [Pseudomonas aeruginosa]